MAHQAHTFLVLFYESVLEFANFLIINTMRKLFVIVFALLSISNVYAHRKGYKPSFEIGYTHGLGEGDERLAVFTTHGYQFSPYLFVGGGVGVNRFLSEKACGVPIFAKVRADLLNKSISPFIDTKIGYSVTNVNGFYFSPSLGCRFDTPNDFSITMSIGYELQMRDYEMGNFLGSVYIFETKKKNCGGLTFRLGFEF